MSAQTEVMESRSGGSVEQSRRAPTYRRSFALSNELEADKIDANLKDGLPTVRIPQRAELRARRIEVKS
jgi:HSP20 family molecular chaperone IbpA